MRCASCNVGTQDIDAAGFAKGWHVFRIKRSLGLSSRSRVSTSTTSLRIPILTCAIFLTHQALGATVLLSPVTSTARNITLRWLREGREVDYYYIF